MLNLQPDLSGALFIIAIVINFYWKINVARNDKKAGAEGGKVAQIIILKWTNVSQLRNWF